MTLFKRKSVKSKEIKELEQSWENNWDTKAESKAIEEEQFPIKVIGETEIRTETSTISKIGIPRLARVSMSEIQQQLQC